MRRPLALVAATALASGAVLAGAHSALALPGGPAFSVASPAPTHADQDQAKIDKEVPKEVTPKLAVKDLRHEVDAGGHTVYTVEFSNPSKSDLIFLPAVLVQSQKGGLSTHKITMDYLDYRSKDWQHSSIPNRVDDEHLDEIRVLGAEENGEPGPSDLIVLEAGKKYTAKIRLGLPDDAPLGPAYTQFVAYWSPLDVASETDEIGQLSFSAPGYFCIGAPDDNGGSPSPSPSKSVPAPSPSKSVPAPSPSKSVPAPSPTSESPTPSVSASTSAPATGTTTPAGGSTSTPPDTAPPVTPFPVTPPSQVTVPVTTTGIQQAKAAAASQDKDLAFTGGGSDATPIAIAGATVLAAGVGTLVLLRRRKQAGRHA
ncbi:LPXTG cell wall anchor domain-containing protein [Kitasatospora sp. NPDC058965]|uniref:LPXTG cell wall anchor domain-containing protein n=1 Tax=Kitasatospora sp. NPDC058965 TaxID=3346682 RepID=UPI0036B4A626